MLNDVKYTITCYYHKMVCVGSTIYIVPWSGCSGPQALRALHVMSVPVLLSLGRTMPDEEKEKAAQECCDVWGKWRAGAPQ